jgi:ribonuclease P/MRP protein subunit RPP40
MHLKFNEHIYAKINKGYSMLGIIIRNFGTILDEIFVLLYKSLVRPHLEYANVVCSPYMQNYIEVIEKSSKESNQTYS